MHIQKSRCPREPPAPGSVAESMLLPELQHPEGPDVGFVPVRGYRRLQRQLEVIIYRRHREPVELVTKVVNPSCNRRFPFVAAFV